ncbi:ATP-binding protein [Streptomyces sp. NPDC087226]|uniref:ATP-binding protein n=1 Tax=Streptomyces sp. NPDC087226 TaxID=3365771 RepID=UPI003826A6E4
MADAGTDFGTLLRDLRHRAGLTIEGLAEASGVSARGIGNLERGERAVPQRRTVAALAGGLGLDEAERERLLTATRAARAGRAEHGSGAVPAGTRVLPGGPDDFVGRQKELARLLALADETVARHDVANQGYRGAGEQPAVVVAVSGAPGAGKTTLVFRAARELAGRFPDGQLLVDLRGMDDEPPEPAESMLTVLKALGVADRDLLRAGPQGHPELYRRVLAERRLLLVLDNARDEAQVRPLLPGTGAGMTLVTSRRMLTGLESVHRIHIGELGPPESAAFLTALVGAERAVADPEALTEVARRCGHLPLALRVAGNWLATRSGWTVRRLADRLAGEERRLEALAAAGTRVSAAFDLSYRQLTPAAARMFRLLALVEGPDCGAACAAALAGRDLFEAEDVLEELIESGLLIGSEAGRYAFHDLLRLFARTRLDAEESAAGAAAARRAMHQWLLETAVVAGRWYEPGHGAPPPAWQGTVDLSSADRARRWLQAEGANWLAALRAAAAAGEHAVVVEVAEALHWFSDLWIFWGHWPEVFATAADSAEALGDPLGQATHLNYHAWALIVCEGRPRDGFARSVRARRAAERAGDLTQRAWSHFYSAWALQMQDELTSAVEHNHRSAELFEAADDVHGTIQTRVGHIELLLSTGRFAEAVAETSRALGFLDRVGDRAEAHIAHFARRGLHTAVGRAHTGLEEWEKAVVHLETAVVLSRDSDNTGMESRALAELGDALLGAGREAEARAVFTRCLALGAHADPQSVARSRERLARLDGA